MTSVTETDYEQYVDKKVIITVENDNGEASELEGTVQAASEVGLLVKPKGKTLGEIVGVEEIIEIKLAADPTKKIKAKKIKPVALGQARSHLLERHGHTLLQINSMTEEEAFAYHEEIDHVASDLGHIHVEPKAKDEQVEGQQELPDGE